MSAMGGGNKCEYCWRRGGSHVNGCPLGTEEGKERDTLIFWWRKGYNQGFFAGDVESWALTGWTNVNWPALNLGHIIGRYEIDVLVQEEVASRS